MTDVKIAIIGAGSATFSGTIVRDLCVNKGLQGSHVTFMDVNQNRLKLVQGMGERLSDELGAGLSFSTTTDRQQALQDADFVINTAQIGGHDWTEAQRQLAEEHGYYRGARLHNFGQAAFFLEVACDMERICPKAWLIQIANPVFEGCTLIHRATNIKVVGLCHGHYGYRNVASVVGLDVDHVSAQMPGFNHWIWMTDFRYHGEDAYPLLDKWIETEAENYWVNGYFSQDEPETYFTYLYHDKMSRAAIHQYQLFGLMPIGDVRRFAGWWYNHDFEAKKRWYGSIGGMDSEIGWERYLKAVAERARQVERAVQDRERPITEIFEPKQSDEQAVPIIDSLVNDVERLFQVNIPNQGQIIQGFPEDLVIECKGVVNGAGISGVSAPPFSPRLMAGAMIPRWREAEQMVEALRTRDLNLILLYLLEDQRTRSLDQAKRLLEVWLADPRNQHLESYLDL